MYSNQSNISKIQSSFSGFIFLLTVFTALTLSFILSNTHFLKMIFIFLGFTAIVLIFIFPEVGLALSYSSGIFKEWLTQNISLFASFDFTIAVFLITFVSIVFAAIRRGTLYNFKFHKSFLPLALFTIILLFSILYTPAFEYGSFKAASFIFFNWGLFLFPILIINLEKYGWLIIKSLIFLASIVSAFTIISIIQGFLSGSIIYSYRASFLQVNPILFSTWVGSINIMLIASFPIVKNLKIKILAFSSIILMTTAILIANSRGPLLSFFITAAIILVVRFKKNAKKKIIFSLFAVIFILAIIIAALPPQLTDRYFEILQLKRSTKYVALYTVNSRLTFWRHSLELATANLKNFFFGIGVGGFSKEYLHLETLRIYPHNIFFEVFCELGFFAVLLLIWYFYEILKDAIKMYFSGLAQKRRILLFTFLMASIFVLLAAQFSGDLNDNRRIWFLLGNVIALFHLQNNKINGQNVL